MADDRERLILEMSTDLKRFEKGLDRANAIGEKRLSQIERRFEKAGRNMGGSFARSAGNINNAIAGIAVGAAIVQVGKYADAWTEAGNKLAAAGVKFEDLNRTQADLVQMANETRSGLGPTVDLYAKLTRTTEALGVSQSAVSRATEIVNKSFKAGGAAASEQASGILQLSQALGSGILQGDELRSIRENAPLLAKAIADEFGVTVAGLKKLGEEGKLTSDRVFSAILKGGRDIDSQFAKTTPTIADSFTVMRNSATQYIGELDRATGASKALSGFIIEVADNLDLLANAAIITATVVGGVLAGQATVALIASMTRAAATVGITSSAIQAMGVRSVASAASVRVLSGALAFFGGPLGLAITGVAIAVGLIAYEANRARPPTAELEKVVGDLAKATSDYEAASLAASIASGKGRTAALEEANAKRVLANETRRAAQEKLIEARITLAAARASAAERQQNLANYGGEPGLGTYNKTTPNDPGPSARAIAQARSDAAAAEKAINEADALIKRVTEGLGAPLVANAPAAAGGGTKGKGGGGTTLSELRTQVQIEIARLKGEEAIAQALEDQLDLVKRAKAYQEAGLATGAAQAQAAADVAAIQTLRTQNLEKERQILADTLNLETARLTENADQIRELERDAEIRTRINDLMATGLSRTAATTQAVRDQLDLENARAVATTRAVASKQREVDLEIAQSDEAFDQVRALERKQELEEAISDYKATGLTNAQAETQALADQVRLEEARLRLRARYMADAEKERQQRLAELGGSTRDAARQARALEISKRSRDYQEAGGLSAGDANSQATREVLEETRAQARATFRDAFTGGIREAIKSGDVLASIGEFALNAGDAMTEQVLNKAADALFDVLANQFPNLFDLGSELASNTTAATTISTAITGAAAAGGVTLGGAITSSAGVAGSTIAAAMTTAGASAAAAMGAAIAAAGGGSAAGSGVGAAISAAFSGARAQGGPTRRFGNYHRNEQGPEPFVPTSNGVVFSTQAMRGLASLGKLASQGGGMGGGVNIEFVNQTGVPATMKEEKQPNGSTRLTLEPLFNKGLEGAGRSGQLRKAASMTPEPVRRG